MLSYTADISDDFATISYGTVDADGGLTATTQCKPNESSVKYTKAGKDKLIA